MDTIKLKIVSVSEANIEVPRSAYPDGFTDEQIISFEQEQLDVFDITWDKTQVDVSLLESVNPISIVPSRASTMKFSMNGYRRNLSNDIEVLRDIVQEIVRGNYYDNSELIEAMDDVIRLSNAVNCVHYGDDTDFFGYVQP